VDFAGAEDVRGIARAAISRLSVCECATTPARRRDCSGCGRWQSDVEWRQSANTSRWLNLAGDSLWLTAVFEPVLDGTHL
jgi:hypothetical protein